MWQTKYFLQKLQKAENDFDYRIKFDSNGCPEGVCWMHPKQKIDFIRYGSVLFLDAQKQQYNEPKWNYIRPCIKDQEMKVRCACESLIVEESTSAYKWILQSMESMEPLF